MHLKSMKLWMLAYVVLTFFDVIITYIFISGPDFDIADEGNVMIRNLMEQFGVWQGLTIYVIQEFVLFFLMWGLLYYIVNRLVKDRSEDLQFKVDIIVFNLGMPFIIMASALLHLFAGFFWIGYGIAGEIGVWFPMNFIVYVTIFLGMFQAYHVFKLQSEHTSPSSEQSFVSEKE